MTARLVPELPRGHPMEIPAGAAAVVELALPEPVAAEPYARSREQPMDAERRSLEFCCKNFFRAEGLLSSIGISTDCGSTMERSGMVLQLLDLSSFCRRSLATNHPIKLVV